MGVIDRPIPTTDDAETAARVAQEAQMIAAAEASLRDGRGVSQAQFQDWSERLLDNLDSAQPPPV